MALSIIAFETSSTENKCKDTWHHGVLGAFLLNSSLNIFGLTCRHVTEAACMSNNVVYVESGSIEKIPFGRSIGKENKDCYDIDVFTITESRLPMCDRTFRNTMGRQCKSKLFTGNVKDIFGKTIFMRKCIENTTITVYGEVLSAETHIVCKDHDLISDPTCIFLVKASIGPFAVPGDSGNIVSIQTDDDSIELLGMVFAGELTTPDGISDVSVCILLHGGLQILGQRYADIYTIECGHGSKDITDQSVSKYASGCLIWIIKRHQQLEHTADISRDLIEVVLQIMDCSVLIDNAESRDQIKYELEMSEYVNARKDIKVEDCGNPDQKCYLLFMIACDSLYKEELINAERNLKYAALAIWRRKVTGFPNRLFSQIITFVTWLYYKKQEYTEMEKILSEAEDFMSKSIESGMCLRSSLGYLYFDYARFYIAKNERQNAFEMSQRSLSYFEQDASEIKDEDEDKLARSSKRQTLTLAQMARIKLGCGENFELAQTDLGVSREDVQEADRYLQKIKHLHSYHPLPAVQMTTYLLVMIDQYYRQSELYKDRKSELLKEAMGTAKKCVRLATEHGLLEEKIKAQYRQDALSNLKNKNE